MMMRTMTRTMMMRTMTMTITMMMMQHDTLFYRKHISNTMYISNNMPRTQKDVVWIDRFINAVLDKCLVSIYRFINAVLADYRFINAVLAA